MSSGEILQASVARDQRIKALNVAIAALEPNDLNLGQAAEIAQSLKAQTSEAEEHAIKKIAEISASCRKTPRNLIFVHACGSDFEDVVCILNQFKKEKRTPIINAAQVAYMKAKGLTE